MKTLDRATTSSICGVDMNKVAVEFLFPAMQKLGLDYSTSAPLASNVEVLALWTADNAKEIAQCEECGGESPSSFELCPYCGYEGTVLEGEIVDLSVKPVALALAPEPEVCAITDLTEFGLDAANAMTDRLKEAIVNGHWKLGKHLHAIHQSGVWKARQGGDGQKYKTFGQYCQAEVRMVEQNVYRLIDVALNWDEAMVARLGTEKLDLILRTPGAAKPKLLQAANEGGTVRDLKAMRQEAIQEHGLDSRVTSTGKRTAAIAPSAKPVPRAPKREMVTMVEIEGTKEFPMIDEEVWSTRGVKEPTDRIDNAVGFHYMVNDVAMTFRVTRDSAGNLVGQVTIKRQ
jgi:hypothetical protein